MTGSAQLAIVRGSQVTVTTIFVSCFEDPSLGPPHGVEHALAKATTSYGILTVLHMANSVDY